MKAPYETIQAFSQVLWRIRNFLQLERCVCIWQVVKGLLPSERTGLLNDGRAAAALFLNHSFNTFFGTISVNSQGERLSDYAIFAVDPQGNRQVEEIALLPVLQIGKLLNIAGFRKLAKK